MMYVPDSFRRNIPIMYGEEGDLWLRALPRIVRECMQKWRLSHLTMVKHLSYHFVCYAESPIYGEVVLKVGLPQSDDFEREKQALALYDGEMACKCYEVDAKRGAFLLEKVIPGFDLTVLHNTATRYKVAAQLMTGLHAVADRKDETAFPRYVDEMHRAFDWALSAQGVDESLWTMIEPARRIYMQLESIGRPHVVLHGDLHHYNMLLDANNRWKAIDPKGVIGIPCMESARFMENQLRMVEEHEKAECLEQMVLFFAKTFHETPAIVARCLFVDLVLGACWSAEEGMDESKWQRVMQDCKRVFDFVQRFHTSIDDRFSADAIS